MGEGVTRPKRNTHKADEFGECYARTARATLRKVRICVDLMRESPDFLTWVANWETCIVRLRMVGHTLSKVDGKRSRFILLECAKSYDLWKRPRAKFTWYIWLEAERNLILKENKCSVLFLEDSASDGYRDQKVLVNGKVYRADDLIYEIYYWWIAEIEAIELRSRAAKRGSYVANPTGAVNVRH
jgi:hypothetical protein